MGKQIRISFRTTQEFKNRAQAAAKSVGLEETVIEAEAIKAVIAHIERFGQITIPVRLEEPKREITVSPSPRRATAIAGNVTGLNEPEGRYRAKKGKGC